jgi:HPt (histidine-containing phosphotransfer) domain-containing protein
VKVATEKEDKAGGVDPFARKLVDKYLDNRKGDIRKLTRAVADGDFETLRTTGHNLYGSGSAYGFDEISAAGACIERAAMQQNAAKIRDLIAELQATLANLGVRQSQ